MIRRPPRSTRTDTLFPYTPLFRAGVVPWSFGMNMDAAVERADMLVEGRLKPDVAQLAAAEPFGREAVHFGNDRARVDVGRAEQFERARRSPALAQRRALDHHRPDRKRTRLNSSH